ncbi:MAG: C-GCAxxG-C-C family protein [Paludibacteraceae bacterium]|jgi:hypothetical protein|nr:C-GCAxxG-C-C family protein [Paludibacteraceae bacterium]MBP6435927.1 C-GCAxxG-C-C family protein [Paludibacteraceae bacterium]MBP7219135.1 C-GCAxxG-C-C family protein [Paludibacteraceae bacterium]MBP8781041.1 C-GCAxxG-C-C family protein [Paludibacteraceae bacterium]MBP9969873.1 C-GCAxxG-C-C family protein [Paludibacteraceae bacterium]
MKAVDYFHKKPALLNCAQAILTAWQKEYEIAENTILEFKQYGGGRAPEGACGALYAAEYLMKKHHQQSIYKEFSVYAGSIACKEIRKNGVVSCQKCVEIADELLQNARAKKE